MATLKRQPPKTKATAAKKTLPSAPVSPAHQLRSELVSKVELGDNREVRITRIQTGLTEELIRIGINLVPSGDNMSGAVFPASYVDDVVVALKKAAS